MSDFTCLYAMRMEKERAEGSLKDYKKILVEGNKPPEILKIYEKVILNMINIRFYPLWRDIFKGTSLEDRIIFNSDVNHLTKEEVLSYLNFFLRDDDGTLKEKVLKIIENKYD